MDIYLFITSRRAFCSLQIFCMFHFFFDENKKCMTLKVGKKAVLALLGLFMYSTRQLGLVVSSSVILGCKHYRKKKYLGVHLN